MNRNQFLQSFKDGLDIFEENYQQSKVLEMDERINFLMQSGKSEEQAIAELGNVQTYIQYVYKENHVNPVSFSGKKDKFSFQKLFDVFQHVIDVMSKNNAKANGKILLDILFLILITCILKIPFLVLRAFGEGILDIFSSSIVDTIWYFIIEILYWVLAVFFFLHVFQKWFSKLEIRK